MKTIYQYIDIYRYIPSVYEVYVRAYVSVFPLFLFLIFLGHFPGMCVHTCGFSVLLFLCVKTFGICVLFTFFFFPSFQGTPTRFQALLSLRGNFSHRKSPFKKKSHCPCISLWSHCLQIKKSDFLRIFLVCAWQILRELRGILQLIFCNELVCMYTHTHTYTEIYVLGHFTVDFCNGLVYIYTRTHTHNYMYSATFTVNFLQRTGHLYTFFWIMIFCKGLASHSLLRALSLALSLFLSLSRSFFLPPSPCGRSGAFCLFLSLSFSLSLSFAVVGELALASPTNIP